MISYTRFDYVALADARICQVFKPISFMLRCVSINTFPAFYLEQLGLRVCRCLGVRSPRLLLQRVQLMFSGTYLVRSEAEFTFISFSEAYDFLRLLCV